MRRTAGIAIAAVILAAGSVIASPVAPSDTVDTTDPDLTVLRSRHLLLPVEGVEPADLRDVFHARRGRRIHHAIDIMAPRETPILAVDDGVIARLDAHSPAGGITVYQIDSTDTYGYYYAHLERWADGLVEGSAVTRGQVIGYVGSTGNAPERSPHLHFAIHRLWASRQPWVGPPLNPYLVFQP